MKPLGLLIEAENDRKWFEARRPKFEEEYKDMFVAIKNRNIVAASSDLDGTMAQLRAKKLDPGAVIIEFIPADGLGSVL